MKQWIGVGLICLFLLMPCVSRAQGGKFVLLSSTIGPIDSGIVDVLENIVNDHSEVAGQPYRVDCMAATWRLSAA